MRQGAAPGIPILDQFLGPFLSDSSNVFPWNWAVLSQLSSTSSTRSRFVRFWNSYPIMIPRLWIVMPSWCVNCSSELNTWKHISSREQQDFLALLRHVVACCILYQIPWATQNLGLTNVARNDASRISTLCQLSHLEIGGIEKYLKERMNKAQQMKVKRWTQLGPLGKCRYARRCA